MSSYPFGYAELDKNKLVDDIAEYIITQREKDQKEVIANILEAVGFAIQFTVWETGEKP